MATLNTLRTKGGVFLAVIIGISLLAFLLGDLSSSGGALFNSSKMKVGEIDGTKISYQEYLSQIEEVTTVQEILSNTDVTGEQQTEAVRNQAWEQIIRNIVFDESLEDLGLLVSDQEALDMVNGEFISPLVSSLFVDRTGAFNKEQMRNFVANLDMDETGRSRFFWNYLEKEMAQERAMTKYTSLLTQGMFTNNLEVESNLANNKFTNNIRYVNQPLNAVADSLITVTDKEIRDYYDTHKEQYKQAETRNIEYVVYEAVPSDEDYANAKKEIETLAAEFKATEDVKQFVSLNSETPFNSTYLKKSELPDTLQNFAFNAKKEDMAGPIFENDTYMLARVTDVKELPDTMGARQILLPTTSTKIADSLVNVLKEKKSTFEELVAEYSLDKETPGGDMGRFNPGRMINEAFSNALQNAKVGEIITVPSPYGLHIIEITYRGELYPKAQLGIISYKVEPSETTQQIAFSQASTFAAKLNDGKTSFADAANEAGSAVRFAQISAGDTNVEGLNRSKEIVRWAFEAKEGDASNVISIDDANIVVKLVATTAHGYAPLDRVKAEIRSEILMAKKQEYLKAQVAQATSLDEIAEKDNITPKEAENINFSSYYIPELGVAPEVIGAISASSSGTLSKPVGTRYGVVWFEITNQEATEPNSVEQERVVLQTNSLTAIQARIYNAVLQNADIKDNRVKFF